jgi:hypothetical protein
MIDKLEELKDKIIDGTTTTKDINTINEFIKVLEKQDQILKNAAPALNESELEMLPAAPVINIGEIHVNIWSSIDEEE